jgi:hypothetical protein
MPKSERHLRAATTDIEYAVTRCEPAEDTNALLDVTRG